MASNTHSLNLVAASSQYAYREDADCVGLGESSSGNSPTLFMAWVKPNDDAHRVIANKSAGFDEGLPVGDGGFEFSVVRRTTDIIVPYLKLYQFRGSPPDFIGRVLTPTTGGVAPGEWVHFGAFAYTVFDGSWSLKVRFYINGAFLQEQSSTSSDGDVYDANTGNRFTVGVGYDSASNLAGYFDGQIDELMFDRPNDASAADAAVAAYYRSCSAPGTAHFRFDNNLNDSGPDANHLTAVNTPTYSTSAFTCFIPKMCQIL